MKEAVHHQVWWEQQAGLDLKVLASNVNLLASFSMAITSLSSRDSVF